MSDHFSGPRAIAGPAGDICDVYAFPSPERPGHLVLVMTILPMATPDSSFSDAIVCRFRLRPLAIEKGRPSFTFGPPESELVFACTFEPAQPEVDGARPVQYGYCIAPSGETARFRVDDEEGGRLDDLRVYAGLRSDPFFIDLPAYVESIKTGRLAFKQEGDNSLTGFNALSVVVEVDCESLLKEGRGPLFGVVGETVVAGKLPIRLERFGRPEIKNVIMSMKEFDQVNRDLEIRDLYNLEDAFHLSKDYRGAYRARLNANLAAIDRLDGKTDWPLGSDGSHPLTELLLDDYLVVDISKPYAENTFFEIEWAMLQGRLYETCGGRSLNDNVMATLYTLLINAGNGPRISDGVERATVPASDVFPYLVPPNPVPPGGLQLGDLAKLVMPQTEAPHNPPPPKEGRP
ncbi:MAG: DUF4331 domain-containing protein [Acidobacteria bacterium]|nr:MAG: DUF4331 domain-containing protein [Acidobacteriota bacterium]